MIEGMRRIGIGALLIIVTIGFILTFNSMRLASEGMGFDMPLGTYIVFHAGFAFFLVVGAFLVVSGISRLRSEPDRGSGAVEYASTQQGPDYWRPPP